MINFNYSFFIQKSFSHFIPIIFCICQLSFSTSNADEANPLKPMDTSSPRATLQGFLELTNKSYIKGNNFLKTLQSSKQLYVTNTDVAFLQDGQIFSTDFAQQALNLSEMPPDMLSSYTRRLVFQLKEILDRIDLPPFEDIPDESIMIKSEKKYWIIPGTEIKLGLVENGPKKGEYLFTSDTISRIPEFYFKVINMPYKAGASIGWYDFYSNNPVGLIYLFPALIPSSWLSNPPAIIQVKLLDQPLWRWISIALLLPVVFSIVFLTQKLKYCLSKRLTLRNQSWANLLTPLSITTSLPFFVIYIDTILRTSGVLFQVLTTSLWVLFYIGLPWTFWCMGTSIANSIIFYEKLRIRNIESELIRFILRISTLLISIIIVIFGANQIGLPAYSIMAGLGVGGLAVALASQQTLSNLIASIIIMAEKPFSYGDWIRIKNIEGYVESVGFRSTSIRSFYDSVIIIPNNDMITNNIENMSVRNHRETILFFTLKYDTSTHKIENFIKSTIFLLQGNLKAQKDKIYVSPDSLGLQSCPVIKIQYYLKVRDEMEELEERAKILFDIMRLADSINIELMTENSINVKLKIPDCKNEI